MHIIAHGHITSFPCPFSPKKYFPRKNNLVDHLNNVLNRFKNTKRKQLLKRQKRGWRFERLKYKR